MTSMEDLVSAHLARVASFLAENVNSTFQLAELRNAVSAAISNYATVQVKHEYIESMLEVGANVWVGFTFVFLIYFHSSSASCRTK
jgi:hypothetical protein